MVAGGGTGGHVYPALAILDELRQADSALHAAYVGTRSGLEAKVLAGVRNVRFFPLAVRGRTRRGLLGDVWTATRLVVGLMQAAWALLTFRPDVVIGVGGYSSLAPVFLAALAGRLGRVRTAIHEQNAKPGLANRWLARWVDVAFVAYSEAATALPGARRVIVTGTPIRKEFHATPRRREMYEAFGLDPRRQTVLVVGGSLGSQELVGQVISGVDSLIARGDVQVLVSAGTATAADAARTALAERGVTNVVVVPFIERMAEALAMADLVVSRAGATTLAEITSCGKASVVVPWRGAADDHQTENARALERARACRVATDAMLERGELVSFALGLMDDREALADLTQHSRLAGRADAGRRIRFEIESLLKGVRA
ncbi:MAG: UDP-N-acetylglucosamine--N-acetylmuramyl-(pentapeptide) pyrophosphoryl-undecaprenol N-acetylglucosamine transferase [Candidatus Bipolaricaulota bacterium]